MKSRMCLAEQGKTEFTDANVKNHPVHESGFVFNTHFVLPSGGVMIYFDRIEVVNMLVPSAGTKCPDFHYCLSSSFY